METTYKKLIVFTRFPEPGKTKTRLIPETGPQKAADIQRDMTERTISTTDRLESLVPGLQVEIWFTGGTMKQMQKWLGHKRIYVEQPDGDLGDRMSEAFSSSFKKGFEQMVVVGIDCPDLNEHILASAFSELKENSLVLGPTSDGGYYLIGKSYPIPDLFKDIDWGTNKVLEQTLERADKAATVYSLLCQLDDVDIPEDLPLLERTPLDDSITVIIPAMDEEQSIKKTVSSAKASGVHEIIVVDGGSEDNTVSLAREAGARVIDAPRGRAAQMNAGAREAKTGILLFLHADTVLPEGFDADAKAILDEGAVCGAFNLGIDSHSRAFRFLEVLVSFRSQVLQKPYGDQALFTRKVFFHLMNGFSEMPIMEDYDFVQRAKKLGQINIADSSVMTSPRRWKKLGILKTTLINQRVIAAYHLGADPGELADIYVRAKGVRS